MERETTNLLPKHERLLANLGENLRLARLRRQLIPLLKINVTVLGA
jgi:hypothetical protein